MNARAGCRVPARSRSRHLAVGVVALGMVAGCGTDDGRQQRTAFDADHSDMTIEEASRVAGTPLFWLGRSFEGLPLVSILGDGSLEATFVYGDCVIPAHQTDGGCAPPLAVQTIRMCRPQITRVPLARRTTLRGVTAGSQGGGLVLLSRDVEVRVFSHGGGRSLRAIAAMAAINPAAPGAVGRGESLPPPPRGADRRTPCKAP